MSSKKKPKFETAPSLDRAGRQLWFHWNGRQAAAPICNFKMHHMRFSGEQGQNLQPWSL